MATGVANEAQYVSFFNKFYGSVERKKQLKSSDLSTTVIFDDGDKKITLKKVTSIRRIGQKGKKTDIIIAHNSNKILKISIKDNTSIYWGSDDVYIRENFGDIVRKKLKELATKNKNTVTYNAREKQYKLNQPIGFTIPIRAITYSVFGIQDINKRTSQNDYQYCDIVVRGEITQRDVIIDIQKNTLTFNVKKIYEKITDIPLLETPMLFVYPAERKTFDDKELNIEEFSGIRGSFRSKQNVIQKIASRNYIIR